MSSGFGIVNRPNQETRLCPTAARQEVEISPNLLLKISDMAGIRREACIFFYGLANDG